MSKGIAIRTILLLVLGVLVVGILVYLVYRYSTTSSLSVTDCRNSLSTICTMCSIQERGTWTGTLSSDYESTINTCNDYNEFSSFPQDAANCAAIETACGYLGIS